MVVTAEMKDTRGQVVSLEAQWLPHRELTTTETVSRSPHLVFLFMKLLKIKELILKQTLFSGLSLLGA